MQLTTVLRGWVFRLLASMAMIVVFAGSAAASAGFVYALRQVNGGANQIYGFRLDPSSGALDAPCRFPRVERRDWAGGFLFRTHDL
jgi:hypothetical protein